MTTNTDTDLRALLIEAATLLDGSTDEARRSCADRLVEAAERVGLIEAVVAAAEAQADTSGDSLLQHVVAPNDAAGEHAAWIAWSRAAHHTEAAVRAMREAVTQ